MPIQARQRERIHRVAEWLTAAAPVVVDPILVPDVGGGREHRADAVIVDQIASMTESAGRTDKQNSGRPGALGLIAGELSTTVCEMSTTNPDQFGQRADPDLAGVVSVDADEAGRLALEYAGQIHLPDLVDARDGLELNRA